MWSFSHQVTIIFFFCALFFVLRIKIRVEAPRLAGSLLLSLSEVSENSSLRWRRGRRVNWSNLETNPLYLWLSFSLTLAYISTCLILFILNLHFLYTLCSISLYSLLLSLYTRCFSFIDFTHLSKKAIVHLNFYLRGIVRRSSGALQ